MPFFYHELPELANMAAIKSALAVVSAFALEMMGHPDSAARWLLFLMLADLTLGMARAWKEGTFKGARLKAGAFKFFRYWVAVTIFVMVDAAVRKALPGLPLSLRDTFIAYLAINEAFSCVDHLAFFHMPVPDVFLCRLRDYRDSLTKDSEKEGASA